MWKQDKRVPAILAVAKRFVADMGVPGPFQTANGSECRNRTLMWWSRDLLRVDCVIHAVAEGSVERALARTMNAGLAARLEVNIPGRAS